MYLLDTNVVSHLLRYGPTANLEPKIAAIPPSALWISVISVEEMLEGRMAAIRRAKTQRQDEKLPSLYAYLADILGDLQKFQVLPFDNAALAAFQAIPTKIRQRAGTQDCRIAAIALAHGFTVVTYNVSDFHLIPNLKLEDWSQTIA